MHTHAGRTQENDSHVVVNEMSQKHNGGNTIFQFIDNRPETVTQRKLQKMAISSPLAKQANHLQSIANSPSANPIQKQGMDEEELLQGKFNPLQKHKNHSELLTNLKSEGDNLSIKTNSASSIGSTLQMHPVKGWGFYTSSLDTAKEKQHFKDEAAVIVWEAAQPAPAVDVAPVADVAPAVEPAKVPVVTIYPGMTLHYKDHKSNDLPKNNGELIKYVLDNYDQFELKGDNYILNLGDIQTKKKGGGWELRNWSIMVWDNDRIHHYGPLGYEV